MKLIWEQTDRHGYEFRIGCPDEDTGSLGGILGQSDKDGNGAAPTDRDDWEWWAANKSVLDMTPRVLRDSTGFFWESERSAKAALRIIKAALSQERPLPEWAKTALAAGWKPPKGWKA